MMWIQTIDTNDVCTTIARHNGRNRRYGSFRSNLGGVHISSCLKAAILRRARVHGVDVFVENGNWLVKVLGCPRKKNFKNNLRDLTFRIRLYEG